MFRYHLEKSLQINHPSVPRMRRTAMSSRKDHIGCANFTEPQNIKISNIIAPISGMAGTTRNHQCSRKVLMTVSSGCWPEKCHFLSLPKRSCCRPKRERPERQSSSYGIPVGAAFLSFAFVLLLIVSPRLALLEIPLVLNNTTGNRQNLEGKRIGVITYPCEVTLHTLLNLCYELKAAMVAFLSLLP